MKKDYELKAGMFIALALVVFLFGVWRLGQERQIFSKQVEYFTEYADVQGLSEGAPVRLGGITIGRVSKIGFIPDMTEPRVRVSILVNTDFRERIGKDSAATIETQGLLGDKFLSISAGKDLTPLPPGSMIKGVPPANFAEVLEKAATVVNNTVEIADNINTLLREFRQRAFDDVTKTAANVADITDKIKTGPSTLHGLIYSEEQGGKLFNNLEAAAQNLQDVTQTLREGDGLLHALVYDPQGKESVEGLIKAGAGLAASVENIREITAEIRSGPGLVHQLVYGQGIDLTAIFDNAKQMLRNLRVASEALAKGGGTLGALLMDSRLYDNIVEVTDDAKRSVILRHAIRSSLDKDQDKDKKKEMAETSRGRAAQDRGQE